MSQPLDVKAAREELGKTQVEFAEMIGTDQGTISSWENKRHAPSKPARRTIERLLEEHRAGVAA